MKSNKEIKENLSTEAELPKDSSKTIFEKFEKICKVETIKNGKRMFAGISCSSINWKELQSEILQKIKELEKEIEMLKMENPQVDLWNKISCENQQLKKEIERLNNKLNDMIGILEEINQLKSQLNKQTEKIKEILKNSKLCDWERILELKSLLSEKE